MHQLCGGRASTAARPCVSRDDRVADAFGCTSPPGSATSYRLVKIDAISGDSVWSTRPAILTPVGGLVRSAARNDVKARLAGLAISPEGLDQAIDQELWVPRYLPPIRHALISTDEKVLLTSSWYTRTTVEVFSRNLVHVGRFTLGTDEQIVAAGEESVWTFQLRGTAVLREYNANDWANRTRK